MYISNFIYVLKNEVKLTKEPRVEVMRDRIYLGFGHTRGLDSVDTTIWSAPEVHVCHDYSRREDDFV